HYVTDSNPDIPFPIDFSKEPISATLLSSGEKFHGTATREGSFLISDVPDGNYLVRVGFNYYSTDKRTLSRGWHLRGQPSDLARVTAPTQLTFNLSNMTPWPSTGGAFQWV